MNSQFPQLAVDSYPQQIFWFFVVFFVLFFFMRNYVCKRIRFIQSKREQFIYNNCLQSRDNFEQIQKLEQLIGYQWKNAIKDSDNQILNAKHKLLAHEKEKLAQFKKEAAISNEKLLKCLSDIEDTFNKNFTNTVNQSVDLVLKHISQSIPAANLSLESKFEGLKNR